MTLQTAIDIMFALASGNTNENVREALKTLDDFNHKEKKYRWHHRPPEGWTKETLPEEDGNGESDYVLAMVGDYNWNHFEQAYYNHAKNKWSTYDQNVIAWMYITPVE